MSKTLKKSYNVEAIHDKKIEKGKILYFIKWEGFSKTDNTWEPIENLKSVKWMIDQYEETHKKDSSK